ncbi:hypothetical protein HRG84_18755 [Flavisolibacter sp. BT320]|nr:hypothetical protein [Flavisolibacter longurius]
MQKENLSFDQIMAIYNHIGEEERHFNSLEMEYRKLASQWLLVSLGAIGFILSKQELVPINVWVLVTGICMAATVGILVLWLLDLKVYHELLHGAFKEGVLLENEFPHLLPQIRNNMAKSQTGGDIITKVILYYFFSILLLITIADIAVWMLASSKLWLCLGTNFISLVLLFLIYRVMTNRSTRHFHVDEILT